ncbi:MAG TPA: helix-turn-helix transcriptional regulator [Rhizomicrobium sp.]|jgi:transcriptional regulator with XRE-family HTH domain|nr:helix-turn-helix transcriptional regulator [Rhizomicrobium sp.]
MGQVLKWYRERQGWQQYDLAQALGISQPAYSRIEAGGTSISISQLRIIAQVLNVPPNQIVLRTDRWANQLGQRGVIVTDQREVPKAALLLALGVVAAIATMAK